MVYNSLYYYYVMFFTYTYDKPRYYSTPLMLYKDAIHYYSHLCFNFYNKFMLFLYDLLFYKKRTKLLDCDICDGKVGGLYHYIDKFECIHILYIKFDCITDWKILDHNSLEISYFNSNYIVYEKFNNFYVPRVNKKMSTIFNNKFFMSKRCFSSDISNTKKDIKKTNKSFKLNSPLFENLSILLRDNPINEETQIKIEKFLFDYSYISLIRPKPDNFSIDYSIINNKLTNLLFDTKLSLIKLINHFINDNNQEVLNKELVILFRDLSSETIVSIMYGFLLKIISTYEKRDTKFCSVVNISFILGRELINNYYYLEYLINKKEVGDTEYFLSTWKNENQDILNKFEDNIILFNVGSVLLGWMRTCELLDIETIVISKTEKVNIVIPTKNLINTIEGNKFTYAIPKNIPMIVPPKRYSKNRLGGYLLNDEIITNPLIRKKGLNKDLSLLKKGNIIYNIVNNTSSIGYKINKVVLDFILNHSKDCLKDVIIDVDYKHPLLEKKKLTINQKRELESFFSKKELQENILGLATVFYNIPSFYIPIQLDFRGRFYCIPEYLNYQSNFLAKSLLLYSKPGIINKNDKQAIDYLKIYGANCYGLDKKSAIERLNWVDLNLDNIINYENGVLVEKAKEKCLFVAFCVEYNRLLNCLNNHEVYEFETFLPVQLDATCNGFQHLSLLCLDNSLGLELNLTESTWKDTPKDFYSFIVSNLRDYFKTESNNSKLDVKKKEGYTRLINFNLQRDHVKKSIMTIPYNASSLQIIKYIRENFVRTDDSEWYTFKDDTYKLHYSDFSLISKALREVLEYKFPKLNLLLNYLESVAKVCAILNIPIIWSLPSGLLVKQGYLEEEEVRIKPFYFDKSRYVLKTVNRKKYNSKKQIRAFMPNLVHSLDGTSLALLLDSFFKEGLYNIYTVHDCFGVTANNVSPLLENLKLAYIKIYSNETYLIKLDKCIRNNIKNMFGDTCFNDETLFIKWEKIEIKFPDINIVLDYKPQLDLNKLKKSAYILN